MGHCHPRIGSCGWLGIGFPYGPPVPAQLCVCALPTYAPHMGHVHPWSIVVYSRRRVAATVSRTFFGTEPIFFSHLKVCGPISSLSQSVNANGFACAHRWQPIQRLTAFRSSHLNSRLRRPTMCAQCNPLELRWEERNAE